MTQWHLKSKKKTTGGRRTSIRRRDKRLALRGGEFADTRMADAGADEKRAVVKGRGRSVKRKLKVSKFAGVTDPKTSKTVQAEIVSVDENAANRHYKRRNVITKGAIIGVKIGGAEKSAIVTSRPGQQGSVSALLLEEKPAKK